MGTKLLLPATPIPALEPITLGDFWSWAYSDMLSNGNRGVYAEFLVAACLGLTDKPRVEWDKADLRYGDFLLEVKSAAYVQSWQQNRPSVIRFDICEKVGWDSVTNTNDSCARRCADCYVFALHIIRERSVADTLDVSQWRFYVMSRDEVEENFGKQKSVGLARVESICEEWILYADLKETIDKNLLIH